MIRENVPKLFHKSTAELSLLFDAGNTVDIPQYQVPLCGRMSTEDDQFVPDAQKNGNKRIMAKLA